jgi:hypothetical protein
MAMGAEAGWGRDEDWRRGEWSRWVEEAGEMGAGR